MIPKWSGTVERVVRQSRLLKELKRAFGRSFELSIDREDGKIRLVMQEQDRGAELMTVHDLAVMLDWKPKQVRYKTTARGQATKFPLPFFKLNNELRFRRTKVLEWIEQQENDQAVPALHKGKRKKVTR